MALIARISGASAISLVGGIGWVLAAGACNDARKGVAPAVDAVDGSTVGSTGSTAPDATTHRGSGGSDTGRASSDSTGLPPDGGEAAITSDGSGPHGDLGAPPIPCTDLPARITADALHVHLEALAMIATANENHRSIDTPGHEQSVDYVREEAEALGYVVWMHEFDVLVANQWRHSMSVLAETTAGDPDEVVMLGAHLDSVPTGPGINDNGSAVAALLEVARAIAECEPTRRVRFAWWSGEEVELAGSTAWVAALAPAERDAIVGYLNFDMIGTPNFGRFVYDGDGSEFGAPGPAGSAAIEDAFADYFAAADLVTHAVPFGMRSDYRAFYDAGIAVGGLFTGAEAIKSPAQAAAFGGEAGAPFDPCYHAACDDLDNVDLAILETMGRAIAHAVEVLAFE